MEGTPPSSVKAQVATPLDTVSGIDEPAVRRLRGLSVTTVEELLGLIEADPDAVVEFVPEIDLPQLQADAGDLAKAPVLAEIDRLRDRDFGMGAWAPEGVEVEERASADYVRSWLPEASEPIQRPEGEAPEANLIACFGPVRNQGERGTCVAHATVAVLECQRRRLADDSDELSEQFTYWLAKSNDGFPNQDGTWLRVAMPLTEEDGSCLESVWPYNQAPIPGNEGQGPPPAGAEQDAANHRLVGPSQLPNRDPAAMRATLDSGRPLAISVPVYNNWYSNPAANALGLIPMPLPNSVRKGGHALCVMGYGWDVDFAGGGYLIVRNSWGTVWAPQSPVAPGYGAIPFLYVERYGWEGWTTDR